jgi:hypothetical protein
MSDILLTKATEAAAPTPVDTLEIPLLDTALAEATTPAEFFWVVEDTIRERYLSDERIKEVERDGHVVLTGVRYFHGYFSESPESADERKKLESVYVGAVAYGMAAISSRAYELLTGQADAGTQLAATKHLTYLLGRAIDDERTMHGPSSKQSPNERLVLLESERAHIDPATAWMRRAKSIGNWILRV